ncbi:MAG: DUF4147 domain-containing protein [Oscillospiraceae bacterium]|nr:DUF4147 domain-containing protein [Oscillospiraceae bacterium]
MEYFVPENKRYADAAAIINAAITAANPYALVHKALKGKACQKPPYVIAVGKAAATMAAAANDALSGRVAKGIVLTKYGHTATAPNNFTVLEAGHPVPDENSVRGTEAVLNTVSGLGPKDTVILLLSGGGSALFEKPLVPLVRLREITTALLKNGAEIAEINCIRKRLSAVKGGRFGAFCAPARVEVLALSDVLGDAPDVIASGPASPDTTTAEHARQIVAQYGISLSNKEQELLLIDPPRVLPNARLQIIGNIGLLCDAAKQKAEELGYEATLLTTNQQGEARNTGKALALSAIVSAGMASKKTALLVGGETTVTVRGNGKGGRNQELALSAAQYLSGKEGIVLFSVGSDGTDGPTDAAGGIVDGGTASLLAACGLSVEQTLTENNAYEALRMCGGLIMTGPTGTNVNDLTVALIDGG